MRWPWNPEPTHRMARRLAIRRARETRRKLAESGNFDAAKTIDELMRIIRREQP